MGLDITFEFASLSKGCLIALPDTDQAILYHVRKGTVRIKVANRPALELGEGESASLPGGSQHSIAPVARARATATPVAWYPKLSDLPEQPGNRDASAVLFRSTISRSANAYPGLLPEVVVMDRSRLRKIPWFGTLIELFQQTVEMPPRLRLPAQERLAALIATAIDMAGLEELENIVAYSASQDSRMRRTLEKIHEIPEAEWTLENLSQAAGSSRSAFVARFKQIVDEAPLAYITKLRMYKAARLLRSGDHSLSDLAALMGYATDAAFSKAFRRVVGLPPGRFRNALPGRTVALPRRRNHGSRP
jgi:AraC-like DNA-binding protein